MTGISFWSGASSNFLFSPASIRYAKKTPIKNRWSYTKTHRYGPPLPILSLFLSTLTPQPPTSYPITIVTPVTPLYCFGAKRFINKPWIVRSVLTFHDAISWNPDKFDAYSNTNSNSTERDWRTIIQIRIATALFFETDRTSSVWKEIKGLLFK